MLMLFWGVKFRLWDYAKRCGRVGFFRVLCGLACLYSCLYAFFSLGVSESSGFRGSGFVGAWGLQLRVKRLGVFGDPRIFRG